LGRQSFSESNLKISLDRRKRKSKSVSKKISTTCLGQISKSIADGAYRSSDLYHYNLNGKPIFCTKTVEDEAVFSKLNDNVKYVYSVRQSDRNAVINQVIALLKEETPKYIYKLDIKSFYESVPVLDVAEKLSRDNVLSTQSNLVLKEFLRVLDIAGISGVPRGMGLSATLSELSMRNFDSKVSSIDGVYFYSRFVDDIILFSTKKIALKGDIISLLPGGMTLNWKKNRVIRVEKCRCGNSCKCGDRNCKCIDKCKCRIDPDKMLSFEYLGYKFDFSDLASKKSGNTVRVGLAASKIKKIKKRLYLSFKYYSRKGNFKLLENRVKFLSGNYYISSALSRTDQMRSGVFYNYMYITDTEDYKEIDLFLKKLLNARMSRKVKLLPAHRRRLARYSLVSGFECKRTFRFNGNQINKIKGVWEDG